MADLQWELVDHYDLEATNLKRLWVKTREIRYAAMAIGRWPHDPPPWAMIACHQEHEKWIRQASQGNTKDADGVVLDEVIRCYFSFQDEASSKPGFKHSEYGAPDRSTVVAKALRNIEGRTPDDGDTFRARVRAINTRLEKEFEDEGQPEVSSDGVPRTQRYHRILREWGEEDVGAPTYVHSFLLYLQRLAEITKD